MKQRRRGAPGGRGTASGTLTRVALGIVVALIWVAGLAPGAIRVGTAGTPSAGMDRRVFLPAVSSSPKPTPTPTPKPSGTAYYVAPNGSDTAPGTLANPWRSIAKAAAAATPGSTVLIRAGTYGEKLRPARSGTAGAWITFAAYPGETVVLDGRVASAGVWSGLVDLSGRAYVAVRGLTVCDSDYAGLFASGAQHVIFQHNHVLRSANSGIGLWGSSDVGVIGNDVEDSNLGGGNEAITVSSSGPFELAYNKVHNPLASPERPLKEGIDIKEGSHDGLVHQNEIYQIQKAALYIDAYDRHTYNIDVIANKVHDVRLGITLASELGGLLENVRVHNNIVWNVYYAGIRTFGLVTSGTHPMRAISYYNNTVVRSGVGLNVSNSQTTDFTVANNLLSQNGEALQLAAGVSVALYRNLLDGPTSARGPSDLVAAPWFVDSTGLDFRLQPGSPAADAGWAPGAPDCDADGLARPQGVGFDIGAYETPR